MTFTRFFIHGWEFRKGIDTTPVIQGWISMHNKLVKQATANSLIVMFRDHDDLATERISRMFKVNLKFRGNQIKVVNSKENNMHEIEGAMAAVIERLQEDMNYLKTRNKLPPLPERHPERQHRISPTLTPAVPIPPRMNVPEAYMPMPVQPGPSPPPPPMPPPPMPPPNYSAGPTEQAQAYTGPYVSSNGMQYGFVAAIQNPTSDILVKLFMNNLPYVLVPEYAFNA